MNSLVKRLITGLVLLALIIAIYVFFSMEGIKYFTAFMMVIAASEVFNVLRKKEGRINYVTPLACLLMLAAGIVSKDIGYGAFVLFFTSLCAILFSQRHFKKVDKLLESYFVNIILFLFVGGLGSICLYGLSADPSEAFNSSRTNFNFLGLLFLTSFGCDVGAYFAGVTMGKSLFYPQISPKKTWAGFLGGTASALICGYIFFKWQNLNFYFPLYMLFIFLAAVSTITGDLLMSLVKRSVDIKDFGKIFPGHGGVLDRVDGLLMASPIIYILIYYV